MAGIFFENFIKTFSLIPTSTETSFTRVSFYRETIKKTSQAFLGAIPFLGILSGVKTFIKTRTLILELSPSFKRKRACMLYTKGALDCLGVGVLNLILHIIVTIGVFIKNSSKYRFQKEEKKKVGIHGFIKQEQNKPVNRPKGWGRGVSGVATIQELNKFLDKEDAPPIRVGKLERKKEQNLSSSNEKFFDFKLSLKEFYSVFGFFPKMALQNYILNTSKHYRTFVTKFSLALLGSIPVIGFSVGYFRYIEGGKSSILKAKSFEKFLLTVRGYSEMLGLGVLFLVSDIITSLFILIRNLSTPKKKGYSLK